MSEHAKNKSITKKSGLSLYQKIVTGLTVFTALSHIIYSYGWDSQILGINLGVWFVVNGLGYLILVYALYFGGHFKENNELIRYLLASWTFGSILAWALFHTRSNRYDTLLDPSLINKSVEVLILVFLYLDQRNTSHSLN